MRLGLFSTLLLSLLFVGQSQALDSSHNQYFLQVTDAKHHLANVTIRFSDVSTKAIEVKLPVWRTGKYQILDLAKNIRFFKAVDAQNNVLSWHKVDKNTWKIFLNSPGIVQLEYEVYANQLRNRVSHIDETHAFLDASGVFMYSESQRNKALTLKLQVPNNWQSISGLESTGQHQFIANNYDHLVDSPIESGIHSYDSVQVEEQLYEIVIWGEGNFDRERIKTDISRLHYQAKAIWKTFPFKRYVYMYHVGDKLRGATEHVNSTVIHTNRFGFAPDKNYRKVMATTAHEFVHTWNVKSYRPSGISPYNYDSENYSDLFWMAEGSTSYFDNLFAVRAKIYSVKDYFEVMAEDIYEFKHKPGRKVMSLAQSSFDTWFVNDTNRRHNSTVSIYLKGSLVSWLLDKEIRQATKNKRSLEDLHALLYQKFANDKQGYSSHDVKTILRVLTGTDFNDFWQNYVEGTVEINFDELLKYYGLKIKAVEEGEGVTLGLSVKDQQGLVEIVVLNQGGPAWNAGLNAGDIIVALDNYQVTSENFEKHLENLSTNESYLLHYFSQGKLKQTQIKPATSPAEKFEIMALESPSKLQKRIFESWIGVPLNSAFEKKQASEN